MGCEWRTSTWGDEISLEYGKSLRGYQDTAGKFRVFGSNGPIGWTDRKLASGPGVILGRKGAYRGVEFSKDPFFVIDTAYYVVPKTDLDMRWLYYAIKHYKLGEIDDGSPIPSTTRAAVYGREVEVPPLVEQALIATALSVLDDRIDLLHQTNTTLEAIAQALFKSWFVNFDPVHAKAEGREPEAMDAATTALFPSEFEKSELGLIPKGWSVKRLSDLVELAYGKALKASDRAAGEIPVYGSGGITGWHDVALVTEPTIIVGRKGSVGTICWEDRPCHPIDTVFFVRSQKAPLTLCLQVLRSLGLDKMNTDAAVPGLNRENAYRLEVVAAPTAVNDAWNKIAESIYDAMSNNSRRCEVLSQLRDTLLPRLISGKLRLPAAMEAVEDALARSPGGTLEVSS